VAAGEGMGVYPIVIEVVGGYIGSVVERGGKDNLKRPVG